MPINLSSIIEDDTVIRNGGFSGAVFLTYTLNLGFFEQIIVPALERAGCSNVLIIADPDGYAEAIEMGQKNVAFAGLRYVCTPLLRKGNGVQHAKLLLMAGPERGRLLVGSGNLTLHGYSRNLEVYSHFEYDRKNPDPESQLAFHSAWRLILDMAKDESFPLPAFRQLSVISENVGWLKEDPGYLNDFWVWDNYHTSIWSQFIDWRDNSGLTGSPLKTLHIFSPYYDLDSGMLRQFTEALLPDQVNIYLSQENTTLDGHQLKNNWPEGFNLPGLFDIKEKRENQGQRLLHAKVVVGIEENGSWCIAGSANMTRAAFAHSWQHGSNLELVNFRWSPDPAAFDYLLDSPVSIAPIELSSLQSSGLSDLSEQPRKVFPDSILITELTLQNKHLSGKLSHWPISQTKDAHLVFIRSGESINVEINQDFSFRLLYAGELRTSEAAFIKSDGCESLPRWIDIPEALQEYGSRSYHERIQAKLDTVIGAEALFRELMEFLFDRVLPDQPGDSQYHKARRRNKDNIGHDSQTSEGPPAPEAERFIVPEKDASGLFKLGNYTRLPYEHNIRSLRDLLSIVLLKLTEPPNFSTEVRVDDDSKPSGQNETHEQDSESIQISARQRLCYYLIDYCRRYGRRICQSDFIDKISPAILLDNQLTLSRILLEFESHVSEFTPDDFARCYWWTWAPIMWPSIVGVEGKSCWQLFIDKNLNEEFVSTWERLSLSSLFVIMTSMAFGQPPSWSVGLHSPKLVKKFLVLHELVSRYETNCGLYQLDELSPAYMGISQFKWDECVNIFGRIASYLPPAQERLTPLFDWINSTKIGDMPASDLVEKIQHDGLQQELDAYRQKPAPIAGIETEPDDEGEIYCPRCGGALRMNTITAINNGKLALCNVSSDAWIYKKEKLFKPIQ